ncbi:MAG: FAD-dependent oxidoreductase [Pseudomonadota bacterium]
MSMSSEFPRQARVVIIGGGVIGCSVAYHLTKLGCRDVVLLERKNLTCGTTWHAAGLVTSACYSSEVSLKLITHSLDLYARLEEETEQATGFRAIGYVQLASTKERLEELRRVADFVRGHGIVSEELSGAEIKRRWPLLETRDVIAGFWAPNDGRTNPVDTTMALAKGARMGGARVLENTKVLGVRRKNGRVTGVVTEKGDIQAEYVVNCAGMWGREVGKMAGVDVPLHPAEHYYLITEPFPGMDRDFPIFEDLDRYAYYREESGGLMLGLFEPKAAPWGMNGIPDHFSFGELPPDWDRMLPYLNEAIKRIPAATGVGVKMLFNGPESFTPDKHCHLGEAPGLANYFVAAGMNSTGVLLGGGVGLALAHWILEGTPRIDVTGFHLDRVQPFQNTSTYLFDRTVEVLGLTYGNHWPHYAKTSARGVRKSPLHDRLAAANAYFGESMGWEYPAWFAPQGIEPKVDYSWGRQNWFEYAAAEHRAARDGVILMDLSLMSKFLVQGRDAEKVLNHICANNVSVPVGRCVYTTWLNRRGGIEADLTVTRLAEDVFQIVASDTLQTRVWSWLNKNIPPDAHAFVTDVTSAQALLNIQGPKSREFLQAVTKDDLSNEAFPYLTMKQVEIKHGLVNALRLTYVGELGYELYIPTEFTVSIYDALMEAGRDFGLKPAGLYCLHSLRAEKAYREYGRDLDNTDTPLEAGLGFTVDFDKPGGFIGKEALLKQRETGPLKRRLAQFLLEDPEPLLYQSEMIYRDGRVAGYLRSADYGHTLGGAVGLGYVENEDGVDREYILGGRYEIETAGVKYPAKVSLRPMYDPTNARVKA